MRVNGRRALRIQALERWAEVVQRVNAANAECKALSIARHGYDVVHRPAQPTFSSPEQSSHIAIFNSQRAARVACAGGAAE
jgi:hypothetical protein